MAEIYNNFKVTLPLAIIFDWDGTLVDTKNIIKKCYLHTFNEMGSTPYPIDKLHQLPGNSLRDHFPILFGDKATRAEKIFYEYFDLHHLQTVAAMAGAEDLLQYIFNNKIIMSVVSNKRGDFLRKEVNHLGWAPYFYRIVGSRDCEEDKPSPLTITKALEGWEFAKDTRNIWFVGDWVADLEAAYKSDLIPILMNNPELKNDENLIFKPKIYANSCLDLKNVLIQCKYT